MSVRFIAQLAKGGKGKLYGSRIRYGIKGKPALDNAICIAYIRQPAAVTQHG